VSSPESLLPDDSPDLLIHAESHQVLPRDDPQDLVVLVRDGNVPSSERPKHHVCPFQGELGGYRVAGSVDVRQLEFEPEHSISSFLHSFKGSMEYIKTRWHGITHSPG